MKACFFGAAALMTALSVTGFAQDSKKEPAKTTITKAIYWVPNQH